MKYTPILAAIETILKAASTTKDVIKLYRKYDITEIGIQEVPFCVLGSDLDANLEGAFLPNLRIFEFPLDIQLLGRSYDTPSLHAAMAETLDTLQHDVCVVLSANKKLNGVAMTSSIIRIRYMRTGEYFGFVLTLSIKSKLE